ncbi:Flp pilus assembly protein TadG [Variovorax sp. YR266]|uniref:TadE/TadG family type IV pilus assembly protein n=1 Tax=Variovorax sp. YR266 TaxID=1884386 RepID=UPI00089AEAF6|nr:TadE/TadG family type IV pilus assembly protein [Variovorax sp. YR266]SDZ61167.1 Flp pilus assembly protein TadG [Variovorax sp. YR266]
MNRLTRSHSARTQRGSYAVEFSIVFLLVFTMLYAIVCYGIVFTLRFGLQNAAEDGARAALRYQVNWEARKAEAIRVAQAQIPLTLPVPPTVTAQRCQVLSTGASNCDTPNCGTTWDFRCQVVVTVTATSMGSLLPPLPRFAVPDTIAGQASMLLDGRSL